MPVYESESLPRDKLEKLRKRSRCKVCGEWLNSYLAEGGDIFIACHNWLTTHHDGIESESRQFEPNIPTRRKMMVEEHGEAKAKALVKYEGVVSLTKAEANEILTLVYPSAPRAEKARAVALCASYGLNPLMGHVFLIPFKDKWATIMGINAKRLMASRRGSYSYIDGTPRVMTKEEQIATFGEENTTHITAVTKLKDTQTGAEAVGYGTWPKSTDPYGTDKGNSKFNMAAIRSESQALNRLRPGEMPMGVDVMPEEAIDADYTVVDEPKSEEGTIPFDQAAEKYFTPPEKELEVEHGPPEVVQEELDFDPAWVTDSCRELNWSDQTIKSFLSNVCKVKTEGTVTEVVARLTPEVKEQFFAEIQKGLDKKQSSTKML